MHDFVENNGVVPYAIILEGNPLCRRWRAVVAKPNKARCGFDLLQKRLRLELQLCLLEWEEKMSVHTVSYVCIPEESWQRATPKE